MTRWKPQKTSGGVVLPSGLDGKGAGYTPPLEPRRGPYRAVVINTYVSDDEANTRRKKFVTCDVIIVRTGVPMSRVPVEQRNFGVNNVHQLWVPRPSTRVISTNEALNLRSVGATGKLEGRGTAYDDLDGDQVLVDFVEGDIDYPVVRGALQHQRSNRQVVNSTSDRGKASKDEYYTHHQGTEVRIDKDGNVLFDTVGAYSDLVDETGSGGDFRVRMKDSKTYVIEMDGTDVLEVYQDGSGQVRVDLGEGAGERLVLGDSFRTFLNNFLNLVFNLHTHTIPYGGSTGTPNPTASEMPETNLSELAKTKRQ